MRRLLGLVPKFVTSWSDAADAGDAMAKIAAPSRASTPSDAVRVLLVFMKLVLPWIPGDRRNATPGAPPVSTSSDEKTNRAALPGGRCGARPYHQRRGQLHSRRLQFLPRHQREQHPGSHAGHLGQWLPNRP